MIGLILLACIFIGCDADGGGIEVPPPTIAQSSITLPDRRITDAERNAWIADYRKFGGPTTVELEVIRLINNVRANNSLSQVARDDALMMAARFYAQQAWDLRGLGYRGGHNFGPYADNQSATHGASANVAAAFGGRLRWNGGNWYSSGNLSAEFLVNGWMNSEGHRNYILSPEHRFIGAGHFPGGISYMYLSNQSSR
ncbi:MAG: CAP domain-containing protein [Treponema sp.]|nr:CAP domain-containing protein [Treponema sp.]